MLRKGHDETGRLVPGKRIFKKKWNMAKVKSLQENQRLFGLDDKCAYQRSEIKGKEDWHTEDTVRGCKDGVTYISEP